MKVIFLDVDGVLNYEGSKTRFPEGTYFVEDDKLKLLSDIVKATGAEIVLSSSWRRGWTGYMDGVQNERFEVEDSKEYFMLCAKLHDFGLNFLSEIPRLQGESREAAIEYWMCEWPGEKIQSYVILDDDESKFSKINEHLLLTSKTKGMEQKHVEEAIHILNDSAKEDLTKKKLLVVDDAMVNREILKSILSAEYEIYEAENGIEALKLMERQKDLELVITDIKMPQMDGIELIKRIRAQAEYNHIAIIANTQYGAPEQEEEIIDLGANEFIYKPYSPKFILFRIKNTLRLKEK